MQIQNSVIRNNKIINIISSQQISSVFSQGNHFILINVMWREIAKLQNEISLVWISLNCILKKIISDILLRCLHTS